MVPLKRRLPCDQKPTKPIIIDARVVELNINSLVGAARYDFELLLLEHKSKTMLQCETKLCYQHRPLFPNFNLFQTSK